MSPPPGAVESADLDAFLRRLVIPPGQFLEVRCVVPDVIGAHATFCSSSREAIDVVAQSSGRANVYVGACTRTERSGGKQAVRLVRAAWADLDFHQLDPQDRVRAERLAHERIRSLGLRPTLLIHTGNGLQAWWLYTSPIPVTEHAPVERFEAINRGLARVLGGDAVHDLARVLRVPGTMNLPDAKKRARGCVPVVARLLDADGPTWSPEDLPRCDVHSDRASAPSTRQPGPAPQSGFNPEVVTAFLDLLDQLKQDHGLVRTWYGDRLLTDSSRSGWDMALANQLVRAGIRDEFLADILRAYPLGRGRDATTDYVIRTIGKARDAVGETHEGPGPR